MYPCMGIRSESNQGTTMHSTTQPRPGQPFWDRTAPKYARKPVGDPAAYEEKLARLATLLQPTDRVLEIGCGTATTALRLAPGVAHYTATDGSRGMIDIAQSKLGPDAPTNVTVQQADALEGIAGAPFDVVCAFSLLHLVPDLPRVLDHVRRQVKPGGLFLSKTVCIKDRGVLLRALIPVLVAVGIAPHVTLLSRDELIRHLRAAGFEIEQTTYFGASRMCPFIVARRPDTEQDRTEQ